MIAFFMAKKAGLSGLTETQLEHVIEDLEVRCWERIQNIVKNEEGLGIEFDENVICDVCRSVKLVWIYYFAVFYSFLRCKFSYISRVCFVARFRRGK